MDKTRLERIISDFYTVSGMETSLISSDFHSIAISKCPYKNFCSFLHRAPGASRLCRASDIERLSEAKETSAPLIYTCPAGIVEAIIPIIKNDRAAAYIFTSMGINSSELADKDVLALAQAIAPTLDTGELEEKISEMKHLTSEEISAYCNMLLIIAAHIGNDETLLHGAESIGTLVKHYVKKNLREKLTLSDIAWNLHCSTVTLTEHFKAEFGITIIEYVTKKRMELAEGLLISTDEPLREVAAMCGFPDVEYFSRTFKRYHGISPAAWRRDNK